VYDGEALVKALRRHANITTLSVVGDFGDGFGAVLAGVLDDSTKLKSLQMDGQFGMQTMTALAKRLLTNSTLVSLSLNTMYQEQNYLAQYVMGAFDFAEFQSRHDELGLMLVRALIANTKTAVASLRLCVPSLSDSAGLTIVDMLPANSSLTCLEFANPHFTTETAAKLRESMERNRDFPKLVQHMAMLTFKSQSSGIGNVVTAMGESAFCQCILQFLLPQNSVHELNAKHALFDMVSPQPCLQPGIAFPESQEQHQELVIQIVEHLEPAAEIDDIEAAHLVAQQYCGFVERSIGVGVVAADLCDDMPHAAEEKLFLCKVSRITKAFRSALCSCTALKQCRLALEAEGHQWMHLRGGFIFVHPWQFRQTMQSLGSRTLHPDEIVFSASFEHLLQEAMECSRSNGVWSRSLQLIPLKGVSSDASTLDEGGDDHRSLGSNSGDELSDSEDLRSEISAASRGCHTFELDTRSTFLSYVPRRPSAADVTQSETNSRYDMNPRRFVNPHDGCDEFS
jgi:hypothetical protein